MIQKICKYPGCPNCAENNGYCKIHQNLGKQIENNYQKILKTRERIAKLHERDYLKKYRNTYRWKMLKKQILEEHPFCSKCGRSDQLEVHHIIPHRGSEDLFFDRENLIVMCKSCHLSETMRLLREKQKLQSRGRGAEKIDLLNNPHVYHSNVHTG